MKGFPIFLLLSILWTTNSFAQEAWKTLPDSLAESLNPDNFIHATPIDSIDNKMDAATSKLASIQDSLAIRAQLPDSLSPAHITAPIMHKADSIKGRLSAFEDSIRSSVQIPDSLKKFLPEEVQLLEKKSITDFGPKEYEIKSLEKLEGIGDIKELEGLSIGEAPSLKEVGKVNDLDKLSEQPDLLKGEVPKTENLEQTVAGKAKGIKGVRELEEQKGILEEHTGSMQQYGDQDYYKEKVKSMAKDHFAGHGEKLQAAQEKLAKIKKDYPEGLTSIKDLPKLRPNPMKGKPLRERLVLGLTLQVHQDQTPNIDISPFVAYKWTERLSFGLSGNYRVMTKDRFKGFTNEGTVYGGRIFSEFKIHKGIFAHAEYEMMRTPQSTFMGKGEDENKVWVDGLMVGLGKDYKIARHIKGNMQVLYNFLDETNSPYREKVMMRLGFSFQLKGNVKKLSVKLNDRELMRREVGN